MKKSLIALAVAAALVPSLAMAEAGDIVVRLRATHINPSESSKLGETTDKAYAGNPADSQTIYGSSSFPSPEANGSFIPYESLSQNTVLEWVWSNGVDKNSAETSIDTQINNIVNPPVVQPPLPWTANT